MDQIDIGGLVASLNVDTSKVGPALANAEKAMGALEGAIRRLQDKLNKLPAGTNLTPITNALKSAQADFDRLAAAVNATYAKMDPGQIVAANVAMTKGAGAANNFGRALLQVGYMADDVRFGLGNIVNNIGPFVAAMGAGPGMAGALQLAAVGAYELYKNWDRVESALGDSTKINEARRTIEGLTEALKGYREEVEGGIPRFGVPLQKELTEKAVKEKRRTEKDVEDLQNDQGDQDKESSDRFRQALKEAGGIDKVAKKVGADMWRKGHPIQFMTTEIATEYQKKKALADQGDDNATSQMMGMEQAAEQEAVRQARDYLARALNNPEARRVLTEDALQNPDAFGGRAFGEVLSGKRRTEKDRKAAEKGETARMREFRRNNADLARDLVPDLDKTAEDLHYRARRDGKDPASVRADLARRLEAAGMTPDDARDAAEDVGGRAAANVGKTFGERRLREAREENEVDKEGRRANLEAAKAILPDLHKRAAMMAGAAQLMGGTPDEVRKRLAGVLEQAGLNKNDSMDAAKDALSEVRDEVQRNNPFADHLRKLARGSGDDASPAQSTVNATADEYRRVQQGVSNGDVGQQQIKKLDDQLRALNEIWTTLNDISRRDTLEIKVS